MGRGGVGPLGDNTLVKVTGAGDFVLDLAGLDEE
jgi:hypothetical protein